MFKIALVDQVGPLRHANVRELTVTAECPNGRHAQPGLSRNVLGAEEASTPEF